MGKSQKLYSSALKLLSPLTYVGACIFTASHECSMPKVLTSTDGVLHGVNSYLLHAVLTVIEAYVIAPTLYYGYPLLYAS